jgi:hypothetical protein
MDPNSTTAMPENEQHASEGETLPRGLVPFSPPRHSPTITPGAQRHSGPSRRDELLRRLRQAEEKPARSRPAPCGGCRGRALNK